MGSVFSRRHSPSRYHLPVPPLPHKLALYRAAVQHPEAEVGFLYRAYAHYRRRPPLLLKEDFAGTAAVAAAWVALDGEHQSMAVESHGPTLKWAAREAAGLLGERAADLHFVQADVLEVPSPKVDIVAALNFSTFIYHSRDALLRYFFHARKSLRPGGIVVLDAYGGPGAMRAGEQRRPAALPDGSDFEYRWEQRSFNAIDARVDNRIHFAFKGGRLLSSVFRYDWRLWTPAELIELLREAGFEETQMWCDQYDAKKGTSDGEYRPLTKMNEREDWVAYFVGLR